MENKYIVVEVVRKRTGPSVGTYSSGKYNPGDVLLFSDIVTVPNNSNRAKVDTWGRVAGADREYVAINVNGRLYCAQAVGDPGGSKTAEWVQAVDAFLRSKGYTGPGPSW